MSKEERERLTEQFRRIVADSGQSLGRLSKATGIDPSAISRFLNGERWLSAEGLDALGKHLGVVGFKVKRTRKGASKQG